MTPGNTTLLSAAETGTSFLARWLASPAAAICLLLVAALAAGWSLWRHVRKPRNGRRRSTVAERVTAVAAFLCTVVSALTSWRFAADYLGMHNTAQRITCFTGELGMIAIAAMARRNLYGPRHDAGLLADMLWVIAAVLSIPAYAEYGLVGGTWAAVVGPVMAAALWRQAIGIDQPHLTPGSAFRAAAATSCQDGRKPVLDRPGPVEHSPKTDSGPAAAAPSTDAPPTTGPDQPA
ncbi:hypothetical protein AB0L75_22590 [Streptomyces sp. NPDC052101]|uniref:hypothetical protein n=1 Tax=Streptomyces sp. NPDC052101 TaxID=3155763 RepID=UPI003430F35A